jgi:RNA polymerase sigma-70 factor (ECF subfamily)
MGVEREERFRLVHEAHAPSVKSYVLRRGASSAADDLVAEVFLVAWRRFDEMPADPLPWLIGVARRTLSTQRRGERRRHALRERLSGEAATQAHITQRAGHESPVLSALARLSENDRELLLLIAWDGLSPAQAGAVLDLKPGAARMRLHRARGRLERALQREQDEPCPEAMPMEASP